MKPEGGQRIFMVRCCRFSGWITVCQSSFRSRLLCSSFVQLFSSLSASSFLYKSLASELSSGISDRFLLHKFAACSRLPNKCKYFDLQCVKPYYSLFIFSGNWEASALTGPRAHIEWYSGSSTVNLWINARRMSNRSVMKTKSECPRTIARATEHYNASARVLNNGKRIDRLAQTLNLGYSSVRFEFHCGKPISQMKRVETGLNFSGWTELTLICHNQNQYRWETKDLQFAYLTEPSNIHKFNISTDELIAHPVFPRAPSSYRLRIIRAEPQWKYCHYNNTMLIIPWRDETNRRRSQHWPSLTS